MNRQQINDQQQAKAILKMAAKRLVKTNSKVMSFIDLNDYGLNEVPADQRQSVKEQVGEFVVSKILRSLRNTRSPVAGEPYKSTLSDAYKKLKSSQGGGTKANLRHFGDLLNSLTYEPGPGGEVGIGHLAGRGIDGRPNPRKCVGHCHFERSKLPRRRYLPAKGQSFKKEIEGGIANIVEENKVLDLSEVSLDDDLLGEVFSDESLADILAAGII